MDRRAMLIAAAVLPAVGCADAAPVLRNGPLLVVLDQNPWLMVTGSDSPSFALYGDGAVIFQNGAEYKSVVLGQRELERLLSDLDLTAFAKHYELFPGTDARTTSLFVFKGQRPSVISVYGGLVAEGSRRQMPPKVVAAYDRARTFDHPKARAWLPVRIEVMIWPYDYAPDPSIVWPEKWPGLQHPDTVRRGEDSYSIYLPATDYEALKAFLATANERGAVEIGGKKWAASVRLPFPEERSWMSARPPARV